MRILYFIDFYKPHLGGVETVFENIFSRLPKNYSLTLITSRFDNKLPQIEKQGNLEIIRIGKSRVGYIFSSIFRILKNRKNNFDIAHGSSFAGLVPAWFAKKIFKIPAVGTVHEIFGKLWFRYKGLWKGFVFYLYEKVLFIFFRLDKYICVSGYTFNLLRTIFPISDDKLEIIFNGVDKGFRNINSVKKAEISVYKKKLGIENKFSLLYYGHTGASKGFEFLYQALPELMKFENFKLILNLIPAKNTQTYIAKIHSQFGKFIPNKLEVISGGLSKNELRTLVASVNAVISPSISEGFGSVHTEVSSMGQILITTYVGALLETVWGKIIFIQPSSASDIVYGVEKAMSGDFEILPPKDFSREKNVNQLLEIYETFVK